MLNSSQTDNLTEIKGRNQVAEFGQNGDLEQELKKRNNKLQTLCYTIFLSEKVKGMNKNVIEMPLSKFSRRRCISDWAQVPSSRPIACQQQGIASDIMTTRCVKFYTHIINFTHSRHPPCIP